MALAHVQHQIQSKNQNSRTAGNTDLLKKWQNHSSLRNAIIKCEKSTQTITHTIT